MVWWAVTADAVSAALVVAAVAVATLTKIAVLGAVITRALDRAVRDVVPGPVAAWIQDRARERRRERDDDPRSGRHLHSV